MIELGHFALILAGFVALAQTATAATAAFAGRDDYLQAARRAAFIQPALLVFSFAMLAYAFLRSDFSLALAYAHSHSTKPAFYQFAAVWGNHEGSLLMWSLFLGLATALPLIRTTMPAPLLSRFLAVQGLIASSFLAFLLIASNPFARLNPAPFQGQGLNPILQDVALIFHPPILYAGYVGLSIAFAFAVAALWHPPLAHDAIRVARPWSVAAWSLLGAGIALGAWWAYRELGWGGFWFWDPVENAALMPWLIATALIHTAAVSEKRQRFLLMSLFLSLTGFTLALLGTFLTRSGILVSVHSFAADPLRGAVILTMIAFLCGGAFLLFALRAPLLARAYAFVPASREGALFFQSLILLAASATVLTGTLYPLAVEYAVGERITVGPPYFNSAFLPLIAPLLLLLPFGPFFRWQSVEWRQVFRALLPPALLAGGLFIIMLLWLWPLWAEAAGIAAGLWILAGAVMRYYKARPQRRVESGMVIAHAGVGVLVLGIAALAAGQQSLSVALKPGEQVAFADYILSVREIVPHQGRDFRAERGMVEVRQGDKTITTLTPEIRRYAARPAPVREIAIAHLWLPPADLYVVMGEEEKGRRVFSLHYNPFVSLIWLGGMIIVLGGFWSLFAPRRHFSFILLLLIIVSPAPAFANSSPTLNPAQEERARALISQLQCITCEGQPLSSSPAPLATALRTQIRQRFARGEQEEEILAALVNLYGKQILLRPPVEPATFPLWAAPLFFAILACGSGFIFIRRRSASRASAASSPAHDPQQNRDDK